jgi:histidinol-phosphate aminotransferase
LVVDLAYASLCGSARAAQIEAAAAGAWRLYSPNKALGLTGVRGAYLIAPRTVRRLADEAPSWVIGRDAVAMLETALEPATRAWLAESLPRLWRWRAQLAEGLRQLRLTVRESPATFLLVDVGNGTRIARRLRESGVRVRDARSFGLERWIRLSAQPAPARRALLATLARSM